MSERLVLVACLLFAVGSLNARDILRNRKFEFKCDDGYEKCPTAYKCIPSVFFCDGDNDCGDNSDEPPTCPPKICDEGRIKCPHTNRCIWPRDVCDGSNDCHDNSDEPEDCSTRSCPDGEVRCNNGQCIDKDDFCSGGVKCSDGKIVRDADCPPITCDNGYVKCPHISKCILSTFICDTDNDCGDNSDEPDNCAERLCHHNEFRCNTGQCINRTMYCMETNSYGCKDNVEPSSICTDFECPHGYSKCVSTQKCIADNKLCNGDTDCPDNSDEALKHCSTPVECSEGFSRCPGSARCITSRYLCDTDNDCYDNSDEDASFCSSRTCQPDEVRCNSGQCVNKVALCDGTYSCRDGSVSSSSDVCGGSNFNQQPTSAPADELPDLSQLYPPECILAMLRVQMQCAEPPSLDQILGTSSIEEARAKLISTDIGEFCSPVRGWLQCFKDAMDACAGAMDNLLGQSRQTFSVIEVAINFVCDQQVDVLNRNKECLLQPEEKQGGFKPVLASSLNHSCYEQIQEFIPTAGPCLSRDLQSCAKKVIAEQCGNEIATVLDSLVDQIRTAAQCPSSRLRTTAHLKRRGHTSYTHPFKFLKSFF